VILNIVVLGEAATKPANDHPAFVALHRDVPWQSMRGMRNRMAHGYLAAIRDAMPSGDGQTHDGA
jgi:uncharacterized protein with HEPN domain